MDRDSWCDDFVDELIKLRPHVSHKLARTMALHLFDVKEHPRVKAREYHKRQEPSLPAKAASKRTKGSK